MDIGGLRLEMRGMVHHLGVLLESRERGEGGVVDVDVDVAPEQGGPGSGELVSGGADGVMIITFRVLTSLLGGEHDAGQTGGQWAGRSSPGYANIETRPTAESRRLTPWSEHG